MKQFKFDIGDVVVARATIQGEITKGHKYIVLEIDERPYTDSILIMNDDGFQDWYIGFDKA